MIDEQRLMKYATAIAEADLEYLGIPAGHLPASDHTHWNGWKNLAATAIKMADREHPPPPGSTEEQLPAEILMLTVLRPYISTACETAHALESAMVRHPEHRTELELWRDRMHSRCRLNNKFTGVLCACGCHNEVT